jgi:hypothetical protein
MKIAHIYLLIIAVFMLSCSQRGDEDLIAIKLSSEQKVDFLKSNFRHDLLSDYDLTCNVSELDQLFSSFSSMDANNRTLEILNGKFDSLANEFQIRLQQIRSVNKIEMSLIVNKSLLLDRLILDILNTQNNFGELHTLPFVVDETPEKVFYNVALAVYDSLFNPKIELFLKNDTFNIDINEKGYGYFSISKENINDKHALSGDVIIETQKNKFVRLPFKYPTD